MSRVEKDPIRARLEEHYGDDWNAHVFAMDAALRAVLDLCDREADQDATMPEDDLTGFTAIEDIRRAIEDAFGVEP